MTIIKYPAQFLLICLFSFMFLACENDDPDAIPSAPEHEPEAVLMPPTGGPISVTEVSLRGAVFSSSIASDGGSPITERGFCWSLSPRPSMADSVEKVSDTGEFKLNVKTLKPNTKYHVRAYARNRSGLGFGLEATFQTKIADDEIRLVEISSITSTTAIAEVTIVSNTGFTIHERGVVWGTEPNPTIANETRNAGSGFTNRFTIQLSPLVSGRRYYVRAYINTGTTRNTYYSPNTIEFTAK